jgi:hypothetical protein
MTTRTRSDLQRYGYFPRDIEALAANVGEFARDANNALLRRLQGYTKRVERYSATGVTSTKIPLTAADVPPIAVVLVRAESVNDPAAVVPAVPTLNFVYQTNAIGVYEPSGLTANTLYNLTFLVIESE